MWAADNCQLSLMSHCAETRAPEYSTPLMSLSAIELLSTGRKVTPERSAPACLPLRHSATGTPFLRMVPADLNRALTLASLVPGTLSIQPPWPS